ncbi:Kinesin-like protein [Giardia duodenalis]|uniref:Kinesin-like protein n=2 Tax=Giardia intestinalis TaxID=5741 RepID=V6U489_GIAIN|nr:Kinesin-like protein [Giardia intestinalis]
MEGLKLQRNFGVSMTSPLTTDELQASQLQGSQNISNRIRVIARVRPFLPGEVAPNPPCITVSNNVITAHDPTNSMIITSHPFDIALGPSSTQDNAYETISNDIYRVMCGVPMLLLAYGVTSAGKTYTLFGEGKDIGLYGRAVHDLYRLIDISAIAKSALVSISIVQIYMNSVMDLLNKGEPLKLHGAGTDPLPGRRWVDVDSATTCLSLTRRALQNREVSSTALNTMSSRSHCIVFLRILDTATGQASGLTVVDLAGSEPHMPGASKQVQQESSFIRTSLLMLDRAMKDLKSLNCTRTTSVSFRSSPLTMALRPYLQPTSDFSLPCNSVIFLNLHGKAEGFFSNKETLQLGLVAKSVKNYSKTASRLGVLSTTAASMAGSMGKSLSRSSRARPTDIAIEDEGSLPSPEITGTIYATADTNITLSQYNSGQDITRFPNCPASLVIQGDSILIPITYWNSILTEFENLATALANASGDIQEELQNARQEAVAEMAQLMELNIAKERESLLTDIVERDATINSLQQELITVMANNDTLSKQLYVTKTKLNSFQGSLDSQQSNRHSMSRFGDPVSGTSNDSSLLDQLKSYREENYQLKQRLSELESQYRRSVSQLDYIKAELQRASTDSTRLSIPSNLMGLPDTMTSTPRDLSKSE